MDGPVHKTRARWIAAARIASLFTVAVWLVACDNSTKPRSYEFFMDDGLAREGVLARCNQDRQASARDEECANARRAAATLAAGEDKRSAAALEKESERKLDALRAHEARQQKTEQGTEADDRFAERESLSQLPTRPELKVAAVAPPRGDITPEKPEIEHAAIAPRPFSTADSTPER